MNPRVLRLITRLNIGGPARQALLLTRAMADDFPTVLAAGRAPSLEGELADEDVAVTRVSLVRPIRPLTDLRALRQVRSLVINQAAELVHTHMAKAGTVGRLAAASVYPRPRTVHTFHGHVLEGYFSPMVQWGLIQAERTLARRTDVLIAVSEEVRDNLLDLKIGRPSQYRVIRLGFDLAPHLAVEQPSGLLRQAIGVPPGLPLAAIVGRLAPIKEHELMLRAMVDVPKTHLAVLGDGEGRHLLEAQAKNLGIGDRVHFTGWWHDIPAALSDVDVVVLSSRNEGTPVSLIEAHACARPAVATNVGGVRTVVKDGETGLLVPSGDADSLSAALRRLIQDPDLRTKMGYAGRRHVAQQFSQERLIADMGALYRELIGPIGRAHV